MTWHSAVERTVSGLGYELVDIEMSAGGLLRVTIDRRPGDPAGEFVVVEDCERVALTLKAPFEGRKRFSGTLLAREAGEGWQLRLDGEPSSKASAGSRKREAAAEPVERLLAFRLDEVREARLVPELDFKGRRFLPAASRDAAPGDGRGAGEGGGR